MLINHPLRLSATATPADTKYICILLNKQEPFERAQAVGLCVHGYPVCVRECVCLLRFGCEVFLLADFHEFWSQPVGLEGE